MDNRHIDLSLKGKEDFAAAMRLALNSKETVGYRLYENEMTLFWSKTSAGDGFKELPYSMFPGLCIYQGNQHVIHGRPHHILKCGRHPR